MQELNQPNFLMETAGMASAVESVMQITSFPHNTRENLSKDSERRI